MSKLGLGEQKKERAKKETQMKGKRRVELRFGFGGTYLCRRAFGLEDKVF